MATILLAGVGSAIGASIGGGVLGLSSVAIGKAIGATVGRAIDSKILGGGSDPVETGRVDRFRLTGASEGAPIAQLYGRARLAGHVIWATKFKEHSETTGGGKGAPSQPEMTSYSYSVSLALALCEGEITRVGRVWADGQEVPSNDLNMRVYPGDETQLPDPKIEADMGAGNAPAYRGTAYVVIEDLNLSQFGNRIPQFSFEVSRPEQEDQKPELALGTKAVAVIPGTGEYALATTKVSFAAAPGEAGRSNINSPSGLTDFQTSLDMLDRELPNCGASSLIVSWFGSDLRCGSCDIQPKVEQTTDDGIEMPWTVSGIGRSSAGIVPYEDGRAVYGGTPTDQSVKEAISAMAAKGQKVTFYPFILMEQMGGNTLPDPWTGTVGQPKLPWRGRITTSLAPGVSGTPDGTSAAETEVNAFFGNAQVSDFTVTADGVDYNGPAEFSYRRFILHNAHLCASAGGVDAFLIGSEMRGLTQIRGAGHSFPAVEKLVELLEDVRSILGGDVKLSYAADWSEYFGYHPSDGTGNVYYHLDPIWAHEECDFIGIDNYMPLSDWREGADQLDASYRSIYDLDYLKANIEGGEGYDWYYASDADRDGQIRSLISDGAHGEPWVYRYKDLRNWWYRSHHNRIDGVRHKLPTDWLPGSKPFWFTELGCAAVDKATNQPNKFIDPKSSESTLPHYSSGRRDDLIQMQYLQAMYEYWGESANNPTHSATGVRMIDMDRAHVWAWDGRPYPEFPRNLGLWSDGNNYLLGHWLNGRSSSRSLASVVGEICERSGVQRYDVSKLFGLVRGYLVRDVTSGRAALQSLMLAYGVEVSEHEGVLHFRTRTGFTDHQLDPDKLALSPERDSTLERVREAEAEQVGRVRLSYVESEGDYELRSTEAALADEDIQTVSQTEFPLILTQAEAQDIAERWLSEARVARDRASFALPPSELDKVAGDIVEIATDAGTEHFRLDHIEQAGVQLVKATRVEAGVYGPTANKDAPILAQAFTPPPIPFPLFLDLPLIRGDEVPHAPHLAASSRPWVRKVAAYSSASDNGYALNTLLDRRAVIGVTQTALPKATPAVVDHGAPLQVKLIDGTLSSVELADMLNGANVAAIGDGSPDNWEVFQFTTATLVADRTYEISGRLRGQLGSDALMPDSWPVGSYFVLLDGRAEQINLASTARGVDRNYRIGAARLPVSDPSFQHKVLAFQGNGLRPYAPVHLVAQSNGAGGQRFNWVRRTRLDGDQWGMGDVPLGETNEQYQLRVLNGGVIVREEQVSSPEWVYTAAQIAEDGITGAYRVEVAQISDRFGPGLYAGLDMGA
ncbi:glycoside hydrolase TIM-barrel-like domain-containing protein [Aliiroseovarius sp. KMU-50]|uniref:Glycoside hydrolase TIM-barrel-like domain-containing protein n=1 Tax=Aliiroseovarius salicola TaxID=3009082 RepID=A0ABT4W3P2_9RHOB|nr:glycoside hydrolase TIM-barrel-like domain-containing protein [Aliiroseovarius sp. KMU-50]MDA5094412.1 glycoside hydrolase TIM-barrel-like domain-containing protein [Aliiroseovarius sp. KMU-50]